MEYPKLEFKNNRGRKLTDEQILEIKERYLTGKETLRALGREYGVDYRTIKFHVSQKEKERVAQKRREYHERGRTIPEKHMRVLQLRKEHQTHKFNIQYRPLRNWYNEYYKNKRNEKNIRKSKKEITCRSENESLC